MRNALSSASQFSHLLEIWRLKQSRLVRSCSGVDRVTGERFKASLNSNLSTISSRMREGYSPSGLLAIVKPKGTGGERVICVPTIADRIVQFSLLEHFRPRLKRVGLDNPISFGLAPGKARSVIGARDFACKARAERPWVYKTDIQKFFDTLDRSRVLSCIAPCVPQRSLRPIIGSFLRTEITEGLASQWRKAVAEAGIKEGCGVRQGMPLSPFFAGAYLRDLDRWLMRQGHPAARYVDDIVVFFETEAEAREFHPRMKEQMALVGLTIGDIGSPGSKTHLYPPDLPADFLGMEIKRKGDTYCLFVSQAIVQKIGNRFAELSAIERLTEKGITLTTLGTFIGNMQCGYRNAYDAAHNFDDFKKELEELGAGLKECVLYHLFGAQLEHLTSNELKFVGVA
jgi:RNA-directed DNA polymerase